MRLIDADALINHLNDYALQESFFGDMKGIYTYRIIMECIKAVEEASTAYDKEKVRQQLIEMRNEEIYKPDSIDRYTEARSKGRYSAFSESISIVKRGGIEQ